MKRMDEKIIMELIKSRIFITMAIYGIMVGIISIVVWPKDSTLLFILNGPGVWLGDIVYASCINYLGNPPSPQAHFTIPWILRIPQVYLLTSIVFWSLIGAVIRFVMGGEEDGE